MTVLPASWGRLLTPLAWGAALGVTILVILAILVDPFGGRARRLDRAEQAAVIGRVEADLRHRQQLAQQEIIIRQRDLQAQQRATEAFTNKFIEEARGQEDAKTPLGDARYQRLDEHDRWVCEQARQLGGCDARSGPAAGG